MENIFSIFHISGQGLSVQRLRLKTVAKNIANAEVTKTQNGGPYRREVVIVRAIEPQPFVEHLKTQIALVTSRPDHFNDFWTQQRDQQADLTLRSRIAKDATPPRLVYDPTHPDANAEGYVAYPNVNIVTEMVEMIAAERGFQANTAVLTATKNIAREAIEI